MMGCEIEEYDYTLEMCNKSPTGGKKLPLEGDRLERRRQQNREAAQRCRRRRREHSSGVFKSYQSLECENTELRFQIRSLEKERAKLAAIWQRMAEACPNPTELHFTSPQGAMCAGSGCCTVQTGRGGGHVTPRTTATLSSPGHPCSMSSPPPSTCSVGQQEAGPISASMSALMTAVQPDLITDPAMAPLGAMPNEIPSSYQRFRSYHCDDQSLSGSESSVSTLGSPTEARGWPMTEPQYYQSQTSPLGPSADQFGGLSILDNSLATQSTTSSSVIQYRGAPLSSSSPHNLSMSPPYSQAPTPYMSTSQYTILHPTQTTSMASSLTGRSPESLSNLSYSYPSLSSACEVMAPPNTSVGRGVRGDSTDGPPIPALYSHSPSSMVASSTAYSCVPSTSGLTQTTTASFTSVPPSLPQNTDPLNELDAAHLYQFNHFLHNPEPN